MSLPTPNSDDFRPKSVLSGRDDLDGLLEALCEERLTSDEHARLEKMLITDPAARTHYLNYIDLHGALYWDSGVEAYDDGDGVAALVDATVLRLARPDSQFEPASGSTANIEARHEYAAQRPVKPATLDRAAIIRITAMSVAACLILGLGVWIGNLSAKPGKLASNSSSSKSENLTASESDPQSAVTETASPPVIEQQKFSAADVKLTSEVKLAGTPTNSGGNSTTEAPKGLEKPDSGVHSTPQPQINRAVAGSTAASSTVIIDYINGQLKSGWATAGIAPSARADDAEWLRRLHLDLAGRIPSTSEIEKFLANRSPSKRAAEIDRLLDSPAFARNFATIWTNLLVGRVPRDEVNRPALAAFLRQNFGRNRPWQEIVFDLVAAEGRTNQNGAANFLVAHLNGGAIPATGITSRLFLGTQLQCAQCHNHPFSETKQEQFWAFNSFFQQAVVVRVTEYDPKTGRQVVAGIDLATKDIDEPRYYETRQGLMKVAYPAFGNTKVNTNQVTNRRRELARLMTSSDESSLAPAFVNRMWAHFHGRSFTPVVDDMGPHVAPSHPQLLDRLSEEFVRSGYDTKQLIRWICNSEAYQLTSRFGENNSRDNPDTGEPSLFSHMYVKPMSPEQLYDSITVATQGQLAGGPTMDQSDKTRDTWLRQFMVSFETEENDETSTLNGSITQSLLMMNGDLVRNATDVHAGTWLHKLLASKDTDTERIQSLFASALSRPATSKELAGVKKILKSGIAHSKSVSPEVAYQDVYWALLNSNEFILNH